MKRPTKEERDETERAFKEAFLARTKMLREHKGWSQQKMATLLGTSLANYKKYETRSPLPHYFIPRFCALVGVEMEFLLMGAPSETLPPHLRPSKR